VNQFNPLPCPVLITDEAGRILVINDGLLNLVGATLTHWQQQSMEQLFAPASRIFLQTHVWPMLLHQGNVRELHLHITDTSQQRIPVLMNCQKGDFEGQKCYYWVFFVAQDRIRFETELLNARKRADAAAKALADSEHFMKTITDAMPGLVAYWDKDLRCLFANQPYLSWFGKTPAEIIGTPMIALLGEHLFTLNEPYIRGALAGNKQHFERTLTKADGSVVYTWANYIPDVDVLGNVIGFFVLITDVTPLKAAESELKLAASIIHSTTEGIMVTDAHGVIQSVNPAFTAITGYTAEQALGQTPRLLKSGRHEPAFYAMVWHAVETKGHWEGETWNRRQGGEIFLVWQSVTLLRESGDAPTRYVSVFNDITELWRKDERIRHLAFHDALTDLPNRLLLQERLQQLIAMTEREQRNVAVLFLDLDRFKLVNDTLGHGIGDELLQAVAKKLQALVRQSDTVARVGGDEFVVLLDNPANQDEVAHIASRIIETINEPMTFRGQMAQVGTSIGIAMHPLDGDTPDALLKSADTAMYAAKAAGKNTWRFTPLGTVPQTTSILSPRPE
jgi:diguanylate cyclase (GGDEF)-like protein/PAS domain S-box-containing protein